MSTEIRPTTVLPARRQPLTLHTADGLALAGELALPLDADPVGTVILVHPLPTFGGSMDNHVFAKAAWRLPALANLAVLRFNTRGTVSPTGVSEGAFDGGEGEGHDVAAAIAWAVAVDLPHRWLVGWSFGTDLVLRYGCVPGVEGAILLSPPLKYSSPEHLDVWATSHRPLVALVPEFDAYLSPEQARVGFARVPHAEVVTVDGVEHLWTAEAHVRRALDEIVAHVVIGAPALPTTWDGDSTTYTGS